jgi:Fe-S cluster biogenesis protein NfuA
MFAQWSTHGSRRGCGSIEKEGLVDRDRVQAALDKIRPALQADGGDVELVDVTDDGVVKVSLVGACRGCPMSQLTLANGVERVLKEEIPEVSRVEPV